MAVPSAAFAAPAPAAPIMTTTCTDGYLDSDNIAAARIPGGRINGFANFKYSTKCTDRIYFFQGAGRSWRSEATTLNGKVVSVATDGAGTTFLMFIGASSTQPGKSQLSLATRTSTGQL